MTTYALPKRKPARAKADVLAARETLRAILPPGSTVYTVLRGDPSRSGMSRNIALCAIVDGEPRWITWNVAVAMGETWNDDREAIRVNGAGMDMGFHLAYNLASVLYSDGRALIHRWL